MKLYDQIEPNSATGGKSRKAYFWHGGGVFHLSELRTLHVALRMCFSREAFPKASGALSPTGQILLPIAGCCWILQMLLRFHLRGAAVSQFWYWSERTTMFRTNNAVLNKDFGHLSCSFKHFHFTMKASVYVGAHMCVCVSVCGTVIAYGNNRIRE